MLDIIINVEEDIQVAILENKRLVEFILEDSNDWPKVGDIYNGVVKDIIPGIEAAFVDIGLKKSAFLYLESGIEGFDLERPNRLEVGKEILVQVVKEAMGNKGPTITTNITIPGRYLVLLPTLQHIGISRRIVDDHERERLEGIIKEIVPQGMGLICRTNAKGREIQDLEAELQRLLIDWRRIERLTKEASPASLVYKELPLTLRVVRDIITGDKDTILINSPYHYEDLKRFIEELGLKDLRSCVNLYKGDVGIFEALNIDKEIFNALSRKVWLECGGYIIIDELEALVAIDVNSGRYTGSRDSKEIILKVNLEAAKEVARQLRLKNLGGIIIVDFIDMEDEEDKRILIDTLERELASDRVRCNLYPLTQLGLVEITRRKSSRSLNDILREVCPTCIGEGRVLSLRLLESSLINKIRYKLRGGNGPTEFHLMLNPILYERLKDSERLRRVLEELGARIKFCPDESIEWGKIEFIAR